MQSIKPGTSIKFVASGKSTLMASQHCVYKLEPRPYDRQVQLCIQNKHFELALSIAVSSYSTPINLALIRSNPKFLLTLDSNPLTLNS